MNIIACMIVPSVFVLTGICAALKDTDLFPALTDGAKSGLDVILRIFPSLAALLSAVYMLRASGFIEAAAGILSPVFTLLGIPPETAPLVFLRPVSGSGALAIGSEIMSQYGTDSLIGRTAAVMLGSTETTFYVIAVYFGAAGIKKTRYAVFAALCADLAGFIAAAFFTKLFMA